MYDAAYFVKRWSDPQSHPLFKGELIDENGCKCAQGDILSCCGVSDEELRKRKQEDVDKEVAKLLKIPLAKSILLRIVNDSQSGCPQDVLDPDKITNVLGPNAASILEFYNFLDKKDWSQPIPDEDYSNWKSKNPEAAGEWTSGWISRSLADVGVVAVVVSVVEAVVVVARRRNDETAAWAGTRAVYELWVGKPGTACAALGFHPKPR